jgi:hypothetical protein
MSHIPQLVAAIDRRLADVAAEISALDAARVQLVAPRTGRQTRTITTDATTARSRRRTARRRVTPALAPVQPATASRAVETVKAVPDAPSSVTSRGSTRRSPVTARRARRGDGAVPVATLELLLADTSAGLSANAIATQAGAGYNGTLRLLHGLEAAGRVRRSGSRRSTVWQLITDDERIAQRAAELERVRSQRRGRARAS